MFRSPFREKPRLTAAFKKPGKWAAGYHTGEDWVCNSDKTLVSPCDGEIVSNRYDAMYGNMVIIRATTNQVILMAHMQSRSSAVGKINKGNIIGIMGNTGNSFGAHLHIEMQNSPFWRYNKNLLKPSEYIDFYNCKNEIDKPSMEDDMIYKTLADVNIDYKKAVESRINRGVLKGDGDGNINLQESIARDWTITDRENFNQRYKTVSEVPEWGRKAVQWYIDKDVFSDVNNLDISYDFVKAETLRLRAGLLK